MCQLREHLARIFFPAHCTCMNFFWHDGLVQEFFSYAYALAGYFFFKITHPPQKSNSRPLKLAAHIVDVRDKSPRKMKGALRAILLIRHNVKLILAVHDVL